MILLQNAFYEHDPQVSLIVFLTDNSSAEQNALEFCWPNGNFIYKIKVKIQLLIL